MLDPRGNETRGGQMGANFLHDEGFLIANPRLPEYVQGVHRKNTVKELLMLKRQKWSCSPDDQSLEPQFKTAKTEAFSNDMSLYLLDPPAPANSDIMNPNPPQYGPITPGQMPGQTCPTVEVKITLFHWQIHQEAQRVRGVSPELLSLQDADGDTCLHIAVAQGRRALAFVLATKMAECGSLDVKEHNGQTALQVAAASNQHLIVQDLLAHGAQINTQDLWGRSPLHVCSEKGHLLSLQSTWRALKGSGQQIEIEMFNYDGFTPLHVAVMSHNAVVKELTLKNSCSHVTMELLQRKQAFVECIKTLLLMGASSGTKDLKSGRTCLHMASEEANVELFHIFLNQPSSLSIVNVKMFNGNAALHVVSSLQNHEAQVDAVKLLMKKGADPGSRNFENELPCQLVPEGAIGDKVLQILKGKHVRA